MTWIWPFKVTKGKTDYIIRYASYKLPYVFYGNYSVISYRNHVFSRWPWSDLPRSPRVKLITPADSQHMSSYMCFMVIIALSRTETTFSSRWLWSDLPRSPRVKLNTPCDWRHMRFYTCSIVTIALSRTETLFSADDLDLTFQGHERSNWFAPFDSRHMSCYVCSIVTVALSRTDSMFFIRWPWFEPSKVTKGQTGCTIRFASYDILYMFNSNYSAISHRNPVFHQMTSIWPFKVNKGQTDYTFRFASYELLCVFYSN